jgi:hypothetical protein
MPFVPCAHTRRGDEACDRLHRGHARTASPQSAASFRAIRCRVPSTPAQRSSSSLQRGTAAGHGEPERGASQARHVVDTPRCGQRGSITSVEWTDLNNPPKPGQFREVSLVHVPLGRNSERKARCAVALPRSLRRSLRQRSGLGRAPPADWETNTSWIGPGFWAARLPQLERESPIACSRAGHEDFGSRSPMYTVLRGRRQPAGVVLGGDFVQP